MSDKMCYKNNPVKRYKKTNQFTTGVWQDCEFCGEFTFTFSQEVLSLIENNRFRTSQPCQAPERWHANVAREEEHMINKTEMY